METAELDTLEAPETGAGVVATAGGREIQSDDGVHATREFVPERDEERLTLRQRVQRPTIAATTKRVLEADEAAPTWRLAVHSATPTSGSSANRRRSTRSTTRGPGRSATGSSIRSTGKGRSRPRGRYDGRPRSSAARTATKSGATKTRRVARESETVDREATDDPVLSLGLRCRTDCWSPVGIRRGCYNVMSLVSSDPSVSSTISPIA